MDKLHLLIEYGMSISLCSWGISWVTYSFPFSCLPQGHDQIQMIQRVGTIDGALA